jgi:aerobic carbon-monoxide dehydrogenase medium subunit
MKPARFRYLVPTSVSEAIGALAAYGDDSKLLAGGQSLGPLLNLRLARPDIVIDLGTVAELAVGPREAGDWVTISAMTPQRAVEISPLVGQYCPLLTEALPYVAHRTIRNRGTIGGSMAHADPAAEIPAVAVASNAIIRAEGPEGPRRIPADRFFLGFFTTALEPTEMVVAIEFPKLTPRRGACWAEFAPRRGDFAVVGVAAQLGLSPEGVIDWARLVYSGVWDKPWTDEAVESRLLGEQPRIAVFEAAADHAAAQCRPSSDSTASSDYRRSLVKHLTIKALAGAFEQAKVNHQ